MLTPTHGFEHETHQAGADETALKTAVRHWVLRSRVEGGRTGFARQRGFRDSGGSSEAKQHTPATYAAQGLGGVWMGVRDGPLRPEAMRGNGKPS